MKKLLITGFGAFDIHSVNPSEKVAKILNGKEIGKYRIQSEILPVSFSPLFNLIPKLLNHYQPDIVLSLGLAADRTVITPELIAVNYYDSSIPDNEGIIYQHTSLIPDAKAAYFSNLPIKSMLEALKRENIESKLSSSAGLYICNQTMYLFLHHIHALSLGCQAGFIHLPSNMDEATLEKAMRTLISSF